MRWSDKSDDNLDDLLRGDTKLGAALTELRERAPEAPADLRERTQALAAGHPEPEPAARRRAWLGGHRISLARAGALAGAAVLLVAVAIPIASLSGDGVSTESADSGSAGSAESDPLVRDRVNAEPPAARQQFSPGRANDVEEKAWTSTNLRALAPPAPPPPPGLAVGGALDSAAQKVAPLPSTTRAQDYSARIKLHVDGHDQLSEAVQSAIRSTRQLGGYVTYVDYGTSGSKDGQATLGVRVPIGRVQTAVARFSELGTILEQQTEIVDLQNRVDRITRDIQNRRDRIAKLEAELKDPTLTDSERDRLEARLVQAKRGLANATRDRAGVLRQSRFAKLDLAFTTEKRSEPAAPPSDLRRMLDDALGILGAELGILLYILIAGAPFILLAVLGWFGARALRRGADERVLEQA
jgi:Domain of unknown function (DUF4349)